MYIVVVEESGKITGTVLIDLKKAFVLVDHELLLHELELKHLFLF
jgi:hypothetical protein